MKLSDLLETVSNSSAEDWHKTEIHTLHGWRYGHGPSGHFLEPQEFDNLAVFKKDVDISLVYTGTVNAEFDEPWTQKFPNANASSVVVRLRYRGSPVYEWVCVTVDEDRYLVPMPRRAAADVFEVRRDQLPIARLLFDLYGSSGGYNTVEEALKRGGVRIVESKLCPKE